MEKLRHKWSGQVEKSINFGDGTFIEQQQCLKCGIYRIKGLGIWHYSKENLNEDNGDIDFIHNIGCID